MADIGVSFTTGIDAAERRLWQHCAGIQRQPSRRNWYYDSRLVSRFSQWRTAAVWLIFAGEQDGHKLSARKVSEVAPVFQVVVVVIDFPIRPLAMPSACADIMLATGIIVEGEVVEVTNSLH